jgi:hypothetical protein
VGLEGEEVPAGVLRLDAMPACAVDRLGKAAYVLGQGLKDFPCGAEPIHTIVLQKHPAFDDMLAAEFAEWILMGRPLPAGAQAFAKYAALAREGIAPGDVPLERSIEGVYKALRALCGEDLSEPKANDAFQRAWRELADRVMSAADNKDDPFKVPLLDGPDFERERTYLKRDQEVYRRDIERGERWTVRLPGGPPRASGLLLRQPKSLLFPQWSRQDQNAAKGDSYLFLAVHYAERDWVFSTDPVQRLSLKPLYEQLQAAELTQDPELAKKNPWFDGARFHHTLIAAPKGGAQISDKAILKIVQTWTAAKKAGLRRPVVALASAALVLILAWLAWSSGFLGGPSPDRGLIRIRAAERALPAGPRSGKDYALLIATNEYEHHGDLSNPIPDATRLKEVLESLYGFEANLLPDPTVDEFLNAIKAYSTKEYGPGDQLFIFIAGHGEKDPESREGFIVCRNSPQTEKDSNHNLFIAHSRLRDMIEKIECPHIFVVLDVCFGGTFDFGTVAAQDRGGVYEDVSKPQFIKRKLADPGRFWLTSGADELVPDGSPGNHSPFAVKLLEALESRGGDDGILTVKEIVINVERIKTEVKTGPLRNHAGGDFLFIGID